MFEVFLIRNFLFCCLGLLLICFKGTSLHMFAKAIALW